MPKSLPAGVQDADQSRKRFKVTNRTMTIGKS
jgi:hypothetical protein